MKYIRKALRFLRTLLGMMIRDLIRPRWFVTIMFHDKAYGGSEEGGWWYDIYEREDDDPNNREFWFEWRAKRHLEYVKSTVLPEYNKGRRDISSVLSEGRFVVWLDKDEKPAAFYPEQRPHYE